jgi:Ca-activated chloride channel family protein
LFAGRNRIPLRGVSIQVHAERVAAEVTVAQRYENTESIPVEAVYSFPLPESASVCAFEAWIGEQRIVGRVEDREAAFDRYDEAMAAGHGAFLLDQDRPNIFTASVGNLLPGQEAVIKIRYVTLLEQVDAQIRLLIPTTISPRYVPPEQLRTIDPAELDHIAPPMVAGGVPYGLQLTASIDAAAAIQSVACPSHAVEVRLDGRQASVSLMGDDVQLDQDFVLEVTLAEPHRAVSLAAADGDAIAIMLNLYPGLEGMMARKPSEIVFIVDRSGSMDGESIVQAARALQFCLRCLEPGDHFNILGFGSALTALFPDSQPYGQATLQRATDHVAAMRADLGGTELLTPLRHALGGAPVGAGLPRQVILLTDGEVANERECLDLVARHADRCRVFTLGMGRGVSEYLVRGLARAGRGAAELVHPGERLEPKVLRQFRRLAGGALRNVRVDWGDLQPDLSAPSQLPVLFPGDGLTVFARVKGGTSSEVAVLADGPEGPLRFPVQVSAEPQTTSRVIPVLMARLAIQELEERAEPSAGSRQPGRKREQIRQQVRDLALRYQVMSSETSFVAIEERAEGAQHPPAELRRIPIALTREWGGLAEEGLRRMLTTKLAGVTPAISFCKVAMSRGGQQRLRRSTFAIKMFATPDHGDGASPGNSPRLAASGAKSVADSDPLLQLALLQRADGSYTLGEELAGLARVPLRELVGLARQLGTGRESVLATLVALHLLEHRFSDRREEWDLLAGKARRWLASQQVAAPAPASSLQTWVAIVLEANTGSVGGSEGKAKDPSTAGQAISENDRHA